MDIPKLTYLILITIILTLSTPVNILAKSSDDLTIYTIKKDYRSSKFEPSQGIYLGAYVLQDVTINYDMDKFNNLTQKKHASFFRYVGYGQPFPKEWVEKVKSLGAIPHIALEPNNGLAMVKDDKYLRTFAKTAKESDVPIFLRYASEMNGTWTQYSGKSKQYIEKWRLVHNIMAKEAPNVMMVWTVFTFPEETIERFYPGDAYVDWVGINIYNVIYHNDNIHEKASSEDPLKLLDFVYNKYSYKKPIQISEYGATHYTITDKKYYVDYARNKITRLYKNLHSKYPRVKSIFYFNVNNLANAPEGRKINDYSITNDKIILNTYATLVKNIKYLTKVTDSTTKTVNENLSYRGFLFEANDKTYVDVDFYKNYLGLKVRINGNKVTLSDEKKTTAFNILIKSVPKGFDNANRKVRGLPLRDIAINFGYSIVYNSDNNSVYIYK